MNDGSGILMLATLFSESSHELCSTSVYVKIVVSEFRYFTSDVTSATISLLASVQSIQFPSRCLKNASMITI